MPAITIPTKIWDVNDYFDLPPGWSMPPEMARKLSETVNKKGMTPFDDLKDMLEQTANDLAMVEPNPENWSDWIAYLLDVLQIEAQESGQSEKFDNMLISLVKELSEQVKRG